ncbi:MAG: hypothetical protein VX777_03560 [Chlamydiota bacterium]|nr:hypothetical protein [Chlamydiota bacterium]
MTYIQAKSGNTYSYETLSSGTIFKLTKCQPSSNQYHEIKNSACYLRGNIKVLKNEAVHIRPDFFSITPTVSRLTIEKSTDQLTWSLLEWDFKNFENKARSVLDELDFTNNNIIEPDLTIPFSSLGANFDLLEITKRITGVAVASSLGRYGILKEDWLEKCKSILKKLSEEIWNKHAIEMIFPIDNNHANISITHILPGELDDVTSEYDECYQALLGDAVNKYLKLKNGSEVEFDSSSHYTKFEIQDCWSILLLDSALKRALEKLGGQLFKRDGKLFIKRT